ncbi:translational GTPase TypA [Amygdalobacter nucleatus]|uniref:translational GTPase TypA n=1 Tax=Amygdalobacter nucleatus TaxID=3029274 RepID=UPI00279C3ADC|nr:translational GTPase TypA [Amygdalobacter nucleatus]WEG36709.1 translational GTPase TypA [Amygdalobacter nucleatus]
MSESQANLRNIAIIAHVDHGKTTLVDAMLKQSGSFRDNETVSNCVMDSNDLERERGITILAKNTAIQYDKTRINIVDTPGHADFSGEVERIMQMVDAVILIVDAFDGPMPQTRFVLSKALNMGLPALVVINKCDRPGAEPARALDEVYELFMNLEASDEQLDFPVIYASGRDGVAALTPEEIKDGTAKNILPLLDAIVEKLPSPKGDPNAPARLLVSNVEANAYLGRLAIGKIDQGTLKTGQEIIVGRFGESTVRKARINKLMRYMALKEVEIEQAETGEIVCLAGIENINIGDTICEDENVELLPFVAIEEPTIAMNFMVNDSPFAGQDGKYLMSRHLSARLEKEMERNVAMRLEYTDSPDRFIVKGRGELSLSILIETMRREGYEFQVGKPEVILKHTDEGVLEPMEDLFIDVPDDYVGAVIQKLGERKGELKDMHPIQNGYTRMTFHISSRALIGYRSEFMTDTRGNGVMNTLISGYEPWKGEIETRKHGVIVAWETGEAVTYGLYNAQERGVLFIDAGVQVYEGEIVGKTPKPEDVVVNVCKKKHVTNMRAAGSDDALRLTGRMDLSLEQCLELINDDELVEVTPLNIRLRKKILSTDLRAKQRAKTK